VRIKKRMGRQGEMQLKKKVQVMQLQASPTSTKLMTTITFNAEHNSKDTKIFYKEN